MKVKMKKPIEKILNLQFSTHRNVIFIKLVSFVMKKRAKFQSHFAHLKKTARTQIASFKKMGSHLHIATCYHTSQLATCYSTSEVMLCFLPINLIFNSQFWFTVCMYSSYFLLPHFCSPPGHS